jgi:hypothetical protein
VTGTIDYAGAVAAIVFLSGVTFAFIEGPRLGWLSPAVLTMAVAGAGGRPPSWSASTVRPRRCCRCRFSESVSSPRPTP